MKNISTSALIGLTFLLAACGAEVKEPVEQIVVREPGETQVAVAPSDGTAVEESTPVDLVAEGKAAFAVCAACHSVEQGQPSTIGPNLYAVAGSKAGSVEGFSYSDAMKASDISWGDSELDAYIADPTGKVPGTSMIAGAVSDTEKRQAIIAYLKSISNS